MLYRQKKEQTSAVEVAAGQAREATVEISLRPFQADRSRGYELRMTLRATVSQLRTRLFYTAFRLRGFTMWFVPRNGSFDRDSLSPELDQKYFDTRSLHHEVISESSAGKEHSDESSIGGEVSTKGTPIALSAKADSSSGIKTSESAKTIEKVIDSDLTGRKTAQFAGRSLQMRVEPTVRTNRLSKDSYLQGRIHGDDEPIARIDVVDPNREMALSVSMQLGPEDVEFTTEWVESPTYPTKAKEKLQKLLLFELIGKDWDIGDFIVDWDKREFIPRHSVAKSGEF
ncbi:MAG TPA: hypothetical protein VM325_19530 [Alphaproteobacteria bacterium]|nr:hypothetical protein [Alphaproteobacteria bacterium]